MTGSDPLASLESRLASIAARYDYGDGEGEALTREALARLEYRRKRSGKRCDRCREFKPMSAFGVHSKEPDGLRRECKQCVNTAQRRRDRVNADLG